MSYEEDKKLLEENDFILHCYSPLEISSEDGAATASGMFAEIILMNLREEKKKKKKKK